jgi:hypothetical protein
MATIVIPDEAKSRLGGISSKVLFFLDSGHPPPADSGMTLEGKRAIGGKEFSKASHIRH